MLIGVTYRVLNMGFYGNKKQRLEEIDFRFFKNPEPLEIRLLKMTMVSNM